MPKSASLLAAFLICYAPIALAAETAPNTIPTVVINAPPVNAAVKPPEKVDMAKVKKAMAATGTLNAAEKRKLVSQIRRQLPKKSDAEKASDRAETIARWKAMSPADKAEDRTKATKRWNTLSAAEKDYQRDKLIEKLLALPAVDRDAVLARLPQPKPEMKKE